MTLKTGKLTAFYKLLFFLYYNEPRYFKILMDEFSYEITYI